MKTSRFLRFGARALLGLTVLGGLGCESLSGTVTVDGRELTILECRKIDARTVAFETDGADELFLSDLGRDSFSIGLGSGECVRTESQQECMMDMTMGGMGEEICGPETIVCVERDLVVYSSCTRANVEVSETNTARNGVQTVDVEADFDCANGDSTLVGEVSASQCT